VDWTGPRSWSSNNRGGLLAFICAYSDGSDPSPKGRLAMKRYSKLDVRLKPEEEELALKKRELEELEARLIEVELILQGSRGELAAFERLYLRVVGVHFAELDEVEAQIAEMLVRRNPGDLKAEATARQARAKANASHQGAEEAAKKNTRFAPSPSLKGLYREAARRIHPDLGIDENDRAKRQRLMAEANHAYESGDEKKLRSILEEYEHSPEKITEEGLGAELVRIIRKIAQVKKRLIEIETETHRLKTSDLAQLKARVDDGGKEGRDVLKEMAATIRSRIADRQNELRSLREFSRQ
jgi:hypothetical protein